MTTITIPRKITKGEELIIIPRRDYERFLNVFKKQVELEGGLKRAIAEVRRGEIIGPFSNAKDLLKSLKSRF
jgi:hypothetical protein